jgi:shikimate kinase
VTQKLNKSFVAEIIGPAGSGKTTLLQLLRNGNNVRTGLSVWGLPLPLLFASAFSSLPNLAAFCRQRKPFSWEDLKLVVQHNALLRLISVEGTKGYRALLVDEGAVFALAKLRAFGGADAAIASEAWMQGLLNKVAPSLDAVIWLDAADAVLAQRIREREKDHRMKDKSDAEIQKHLSLYRGSFERVVDELRQRNGLKVFKFSTDELPMEQIAARVLLQARART